MKYTYSILIVLVAFFGLPPVIDFSGHLVDHIKQSLVDTSTEANSKSLYTQKVQDAEPRTEKSITTPTSNYVARE